LHIFIFTHKEHHTLFPYIHITLHTAVFIWNVLSQQRSAHYPSKLFSSTFKACAAFCIFPLYDFVRPSCLQNLLAMWCRPLPTHARISLFYQCTATDSPLWNNLTTGDAKLANYSSTAVTYHLILT